MVTYPDLSSLNNGSGISGLMALPNDSYPFFWAWILAGIWVIIVLTMYFKESEKFGGKAKILSSMAVASLAIIILATIGTVFTIISLDLMVNILVLGLVVIGIWFFSGK
jgi:chromate transport protein ChrA